MNHGTAAKVHSAPSSNQLSGWVIGSSTDLRPGLAARKPSSMPLVTSRDWMMLEQLSLRLSRDGKGKNSSALSSPLLCASRSAIDIGAEDPSPAQGEVFGTYFSRAASLPLASSLNQLAHVSL